MVGEYSGEDRDTAWLLSKSPINMNSRQAVLGYLCPWSISIRAESEKSRSVE
jgi:hypothetical protein